MKRFLQQNWLALALLAPFLCIAATGVVVPFTQYTLKLLQAKDAGAARTVLGVGTTAANLTNQTLVTPTIKGGTMSGDARGLTNIIGHETWINVTTFGADPSGVTDSTYAIQDAINAAAAVSSDRSATIYFPPGRYRCDVLPTNTANAIIFFPWKSGATGWTKNPSSLTLEGEQYVVHEAGSASTNEISTNGATIFTDLTNDLTLLGNASQTGGGTYNLLCPVLKNLAFESPTNGMCKVINFFKSYGCEITHCAVTVSNSTVALPTAPLVGSVAITLPDANCGPHVWLRQVDVVGYNVGITLGCHDNINGANFAACVWPFMTKTSDAGGDPVHENFIGQAIMSDCPHFLLASPTNTTAACALICEDADIENPTNLPTWEYPVGDMISDSNSILTADITYRWLGAGAAVFQDLGQLTMSAGCAHISTHEIGGGFNWLMAQTVTATNLLVGNVVNTNFNNGDGAALLGVAPLTNGVGVARDYPAAFLKGPIIGPNVYPVALGNGASYIVPVLGLSTNTTVNPNTSIQTSSGVITFDQGTSENCSISNDTFMGRVKATVGNVTPAFLALQTNYAALSLVPTLCIQPDVSGWNPRNGISTTTNTPLGVATSLVLQTGTGGNVAYTPDGGATWPWYVNNDGSSYQEGSGTFSNGVATALFTATNSVPGAGYTNASSICQCVTLWGGVNIWMTDAGFNAVFTNQTVTSLTQLRMEPGDRLGCLSNNLQGSVRPW